jgi:hypothetical protein
MNKFFCFPVSINVLQKNGQSFWEVKKRKGMKKKKMSSQLMIIEKEFLEERRVAQDMKRIDGHLRPLRAKKRLSIKKPRPPHDAREH